MFSVPPSFCSSRVTGGWHSRKTRSLPVEPDIPVKCLPAVNLDECLKSASLILSSDPAFRVLDDGTIFTTHDLLLSSEQRRFSIFLSDSQSQEQKEIEIELSAKEKKVKSVRARGPYRAFIVSARLTSSLSDSFVFCTQHSHNCGLDC